MQEPDHMNWPSQTPRWYAALVKGERVGHTPIASPRAFAAIGQPKKTPKNGTYLEQSDQLESHE
jgi:hypothetical protein